LPNGVKSTKAKYLSLVLRTTVAVVAIAWVFRGQDWKQLGQVFARLNLWYFALSLGIFTISQVFIGLRWWLLLRAQSVFTSFWAAVRLHFLGLFYNNLMPGSIGGDLLRAWYVTKHTDKKLEAALSVFVDRAIGFLGMLAIAAFCYLLFMHGEYIVGYENSSSFAQSLADHKGSLAWLAIIVSVLLGLLLLHRTSRIMLANVWRYVCVHGGQAIKKAKEAIVIYCHKPVTILVAFALTILLQSMVITAFWLLGLNLKIAADARYYFIFFPMTWVLAAVPVSIAGVGVLEGGIRELFTRFAGVGAAEALVLALCQRFVWVLASLPGAVIHLTGTHLPREFFVDYRKPTN